MPDQINPYAAPATVEMHPKAAEWLGTPSQSLNRVATGLGLIRVAVITILAGIALLVVTYIAGTQHMLSVEAARAVLLLFAGMCIVAGILNLVGSVLCLSTPSETGAQGLIFTSVGAEILSLVLQLAGFAVELPRAATQVQGLLNLIAGVTFIFFLRKLARFIGRSDLGQRAINVLLLSALLFAITVGWVVYLNEMMQGMAGPGDWTLPLMLAILVVGAITIVKYASLLADMKSAILTGR